jgi:predicted transcriptional regulator
MLKPSVHFSRRKIVGSYLRHNTVGASELPDLIATVHRSLRELGRQAPLEEMLTPAVSLRQSVRHDYVVYLDCGNRGANPSPPPQQPTWPEPG